MEGNQEDRIDQEAARWLALMDRGFRFEEEREYEQWLALDPRHQQWMDRHTRTRLRFETLAEAVSSEGKVPDPSLLSPSLGLFRSGWRLAAPFVALAACLAIGVFIWNSQRLTEHSQASEYVEVIVAEGTQRHFLADGTLVDMKAGSVFRVEYTADQRLIKLKMGEAHFSVTKDVARPFVVWAGDAEFKAIGTAFNVRLESETVELVVTEGIVRLSQLAKSRDETRSKNAPRVAGELASHHRATISFAKDLGEPRIERVTDSEIDQLLTWKQETLDFAATPLAEAISQFNSRNRDQIVLADASLGLEKIDGTFRSDNVNGFIQVLGIVAGIEADRSHQGKIICSRK